MERRRIGGGVDGALAYFGRDLDLPPAVSGHNSCFTWWEEGTSAEVLVAVGGNREVWERYFTDVRPGGADDTQWAPPYEAEVSIWICRGPKLTWDELREVARSYI